MAVATKGVVRKVWRMSLLRRNLALLLALLMVVPPWLSMRVLAQPDDHNVNLLRPKLVRSKPQSGWQGQINLVPGQGSKTPGRPQESTLRPGDKTAPPLVLGSVGTQGAGRTNAPGWSLLDPEEQQAMQAAFAFDQQAFRTMNEQERAALAVQLSHRGAYVLLRHMVTHPLESAQAMVDGLMNFQDFFHKEAGQLGAFLDGKQSPYERAAAGSALFANALGFGAAWTGIVALALGASATVAPVLLAAVVIALLLAVAEHFFYLQAAAKQTDPAKFLAKVEKAAEAEANVIVSAALLVALEGLRMAWNTPQVQAAWQSARSRLALVAQGAGRVVTQAQSMAALLRHAYRVWLRTVSTAQKARFRSNLTSLQGAQSGMSLFEKMAQGDRRLLALAGMTEAEAQEMLYGLQQNPQGTRLADMFWRRLQETQTSWTEAFAERAQSLVDELTQRIETATTEEQLARTLQDAENQLSEAALRKLYENVAQEQAQRFMEAATQDGGTGSAGSPSATSTSGGTGGVIVPRQGVELPPSSVGPTSAPEGTPSRVPLLVGEATLPSDLAQLRASLSGEAQARFDAKMRRIAGKSPWMGDHEATLRKYLENFKQKGGIESGLLRDGSLAPEKQSSLPPRPKSPYGEAAGELAPVRQRASELEARIHAESKTFKPKSLEKLTKRIKDAFSDNFQEMERGEIETTRNQIDGARSNLVGVEAEWTRAKAGHEAGTQVVELSKEFVEFIEGKQTKIQIDIIEKNGARWVEVKAGPPPQPSSGAETELIRQVRALRAASTLPEHQVSGRPPEVVVSFGRPGPVSPTLQSVLTEFGFRIEILTQGVLP